MSTALLQYVAECFQGKLEGMHCLGAVSGVDSASLIGGTSTSSQSTSSSSSSPAVAAAAAVAAAGGVCSRGAVMSVVRALGVLVCEGRLQGPPRGYREGPHCAAPLQPLTNDHVCEKDNYLCARYIVLVREIAEIISVGSPLSVVVSMCTDCPCGLARATCKKPAAPTLIASGPLTQWQLTSDVLLEYWSISVVPSKNSETMNAQGLYQAVRSRLHFSQVAAWWSRSNGTRPSYVTTRITPHGDENLRKFRGIPIEHTFPLAAIGDGNSIKVTVWALPRMEEVPTLFCPLHPTKEKEDAARALTPTKIGPLVAPSNAQVVENLVLPVLVDDRLQTACDKPGKHHCHCEDEETSPSSMMLMMMRPNGERKRRRSLPCGPTGQETTGAAHHPQIALPPVRETGLAASLQETTINSLLYGNNSNNNNNNNSAMVSNRNELYENTYLSTGSLERRFRKQASLDEANKDPDAEQGEQSSLDTENEGNDEKRYKPSIDARSIPEEIGKRTSSSPMPGSVLGPCETTTRRDNFTNKSSPACTVHRHYHRMPSSSGSTDRSNDLTDLMSKLSFPGDKREDRPRIADWLGERPSTGRSLPTGGPPRPTEEEPSEVRLRNGSLELSQREFNEVLAVLRARTPITRRRPPPRSLRRRGGNEDPARNAERGGPSVCPVHRDKRRIDLSCECETRDKTSAIASESIGPPENSHRPGDALLGAILRTSERTGLADVSNGARPRKVHVGSSKADEPRKCEEHERYLPNVFNKRLSRIRQLFQKELGERSRPINSPENEPHGATNEEQRTTRVVPPRSSRYDAIQPMTYSTAAKSRATPIQTNRHANHSQVNNGETRGRRNDTAENHDDESTEKGVPSASEQEQFRRSFENAASMVFHSRTGLPLTSSPAPLRRGHCCFDYDSTLNSVSSKRSALFELNTPPSPGAVSLEETDREVEISGEGDETPKRQSTTRIRPQSHALLGSFEESALNGRLEPVSTVHGFTAELGASGSFCPKHRKLPVTVFFYTLGDNDKVSTPYLAHINLGKKGYQVPRSGTIQVTLLNPLGTVVKMFVVLYDLSDMPPRSHTFLRQRTLRDKTLRYLVHLRFMSGKSGRIYLHTDIRMIICRKSDVDTASDFGSEPPKELRSYIHGPTNPKFSPRC